MATNLDSVGAIVEVLEADEHAAREVKGFAVRLGRSPALLDLPTVLEQSTHFVAGDIAVAAVQRDVKGTWSGSDWHVMRSDSGQLTLNARMLHATVASADADVLAARDRRSGVSGFLGGSACASPTVDGRLTRYWTKAKGISLRSRRILTQHSPNLMNNSRTVLRRSSFSIG